MLLLLVNARLCVPCEQALLIFFHLSFLSALFFLSIVVPLLLAWAQVYALDPHRFISVIHVVLLYYIYMR